MAELAPVIGQVLSGGGTVDMTTAGISMLPMLEDRKSTVRLTTPGLLRRGDVALYRYPDGKFMLHRVIRVCGDSLDCRGDHNLQTERNIRAEWVLAVVTDFTRRGKWHSCRSFGYGLYWRALLLTFPARRLFLRGAHFLKRIPEKNRPSKKPSDRRLRREG